MSKSSLLRRDGTGIDISALRLHLSRQGRVTAEAIVFVLRRATLLLRAEPNVVPVTAPIAVFGDLHGQFYDLLHALDLINGPGAREERIRRNKRRSASCVMDSAVPSFHPFQPGSLSGPGSPAAVPLNIDATPMLDGLPQQQQQQENVKKVLFLGDYVDRGNFSLELLLFIAALKVQYPSSVFMLRGNHETRVMTEYMTFKDECWAKYHDPAVYEAAMDLCDALPIAAHITGCEAGDLLALHGGIAPDICTLKQLDEIDRFCEPETETPLNDILWADPLEPPALVTRAPPEYCFDEDFTDDDDDDDEFEHSERPLSDDEESDGDDDSMDENGTETESDDENQHGSENAECCSGSYGSSSGSSRTQSTGSCEDVASDATEVDDEEEVEDPKVAEEIREWQSIDYVENEQRKTSFKFGYAAISKFLENNHLITLIRAHQVVSEGAKEHFFLSKSDFPLVVTVFSAPNYCDMYGNKGAVMLITEDDFDYVQFDAVPHPYCLPNFANILGYSIPFMMHSCLWYIFHFIFLFICF